MVYAKCLIITNYFNYFLLHTLFMRACALEALFAKCMF